MARRNGAGDGGKLGQCGMRTTRFRGVSDPAAENGRWTHSTCRHGAIPVAAGGRFPVTVAAPTEGAAMTATTPVDATVHELLTELARLEDPRARAVNERHGDDHGVNLGRLRAIAKRLKTQQDLAVGLWGTGDTAARLLALLICRPRAFGPEELDTMLREARAPEVHDWLVNYVVKKSPHAEALRLAWTEDADPVVASAGWALTTDASCGSRTGWTSPGCSTSSRRRWPTRRTGCSGR
jgi:hypothetical protein